MAAYNKSIQTVKKITHLDVFYSNDNLILGNITRTCLKDGNWQLPQYNCVRKTVTNVAEKVRV